MSLFNAADSSSDLQPPADQSHKPLVDADVRVLKSGAVIISNQSKTETWDSVNIYLNGEPLSGFACRLENVKPLDSKVIPLTEFVKDNGDRFNPRDTKVLYVWIGGGKYDYQKYGF